MDKATYNVNIWCSVCELRKKEYLASDWCFECEQGLCQECEVQHKFTKPSKDHSTIPIANYVSLPPFVKNLNSYCHEHNKQLDLYCPDHKEPCCAMCLVGTHRDCIGITSLQYILRNSTHEELLYENCNNISDMCNFIRKLKDERNASLSNFRQQMELCQKQFESIRRDIINYIDKIQSELMRCLNKSYVEYEEKSKRFLADLLDNEKKIEELEINKAKENATKFQIFLTSIELEKVVSETKACVHNLVHSSSLQGIDLQRLSNVDLRTPLREANLIDNIGTVEYPSSVEYVHEKAKHAQLSVDVPRTIESISLHKRQEMNILGRDQCNIVGCTRSPTGEYVFCDFSENRQLVVFGSNGLFKRRIKTKEKPVCATFINNGRLAITFPDECKVKILDYESGTVLMEQKLTERVVGVKCVEGGLVVGCSNKLVKLDTDGTVTMEISLPDCDSPHLECIGDHFIVGIDNEIHWLDKSGNYLQKYAFENKERIEGITADTFGNVYVSCYTSHQVVVLSKDGTDMKKLLNETKQPTGLSYDPRRNQLVAIVCSRDRGVAVIYDIKF